MAKKKEKKVSEMPAKLHKVEKIADFIKPSAKDAMDICKILTLKNSPIRGQQFEDGTDVIYLWMW